MICPKCNREKLRILHTYPVPAGVLKEAVCEPCDVKFALLTVVAVEADAFDKSAYSLAKRVREGKLSPLEILEQEVGSVRTRPRAKSGPRGGP